MTRDPARIDVVIDALRTAWHERPDQRLIQLIFNAVSLGRPQAAIRPSMDPGLYNTEESTVLAGLRVMEGVDRRRQSTTATGSLSDTLRRAATLMRERAEKGAAQSPTSMRVEGVWLGSRFHMTWHPAVALAVADWLDMQAGCVQNYGPNAESPWVKPHTQMALAVALTYLGEES